MPCLFLGPPTSNVVVLLLALIGTFAVVLLVSVIVKWIQKQIWKGKARMLDTLEEFKSLLAMAAPRLLSISEAESSARHAPDKWSRKEVLGHLIDSASNNHQRFVRAQLSSEIRLAGYEQESWVRTQDYAHEHWEDLVQLWKTYNLHLYHMGTKISSERLNNMCFIGENEPVTLEFLFADYVRHVRHHLEQIFE